MAKREQQQLERARGMRRDPTWAELRLWTELRRRQLGVRFRRQEPIGPYIVDFVCLARRLVVEVDGASHFDEPPAEAQRRDRYLRGRGFAVLHFDDEYVYEHLPEAIEIIAHVLSDPSAQWRYEEP